MSSLFAALVERFGETPFIGVRFGRSDNRCLPFVAFVSAFSSAVTDASFHLLFLFLKSDCLFVLLLFFLAPVLLTPEACCGNCCEGGTAGQGLRFSAKGFNDGGD